MNTIWICVYICEFSEICGKRNDEKWILILKKKFIMNQLNEITQPVILFDGVCILCSNIVQFVIKRDRKNIFCFASLQSDFGNALLHRSNLPVNTFNSLANCTWLLQRPAPLLAILLLVAVLSFGLVKLWYSYGLKYVIGTIYLVLKQRLVVVLAL